MIVQMPTKTQAAKLTGGLVLCDEKGTPMSKVKLDNALVPALGAGDPVVVAFRLGRMRSEQGDL
jgi:hypothetical protein